ncbi:MAG: NAD(P)-dependent alcohol dehydrogenase [Leptospiraceae bacterium]|nr:NAD(P)-dependent alcohol dehydrogenase [Leptospiraceae bacterium]
MRVIEFHKYGSADELKIVERPRPVPGPGEVLIRIHASAVNSGDWRVRKADPFLVRLFFGLRRPRAAARVLGSVLSGVVAETGTDVHRFQPGDRVFGMSDLAMGCHAEYICLPENAPITTGLESLSHAEAASIPFGLHTAHHFLTPLSLQQGNRLLVLGASGAVGSAAVQLGKSLGCAVTAVTSTANIELVQSLGADQVLDYTRRSLADLKQSFDVIFASVDHYPVSSLRPLLKPGGQLVLVSAGIKDMLLAPLRSLIWKCQIHTGVAAVSQELMTQFRGLIETGSFKPVLEKSYPMHAVAEAHRHAERGHKKGNIALCLVD